MGPVGRASSASFFLLSFLYFPESCRLCSEVSHRHVIFVCINVVGSVVSLLNQGGSYDHGI